MENENFPQALIIYDILPMGLGRQWRSTMKTGRPNRTEGANEIKAERLRRGLTQREMAALCGVDLRTYQRWEERTMISKRILTAVLAILATACGSDGSGKSDKFEGTPQPAAAPAPAPAPAWGSLYLDSEADLPACGSDRKGHLAYLKTPGEFRACDGTAWSVVDIKGKDGKDGKDGAQGAKGDTGAQGATGPAGAPNRIETWGRCSKVWTMPSSVGGAMVLVAWDFKIMNNGDVFTKCSIQEPGYEFVNTEMFAAGTAGALLRACAVRYDADATSDFGRFEIEAGAVTYTSSVNSGAPTASYTFDPAADCQTTTYP